MKGSGSRLGGREVRRNWEDWIYYIKKNIFSIKVGNSLKNNSIHAR